MTRRLVYLLAGTAGLPLLALLAFVIFQPIKVLPRMALAPGFALTDQDGEPLTSEDLRGAITLYSFTYTHCVDPCPPTAELMRDVQTDLVGMDLDGVPVRLVTVTIDPERDTPEALHAFGERLGADFSRWTFATGDDARLRQVVGNGFDVFYTRRADGSFEFDTRLWLVDGAGLIRAEYSTYLPSKARLLRDIRLVADEARNSQGWARYAYETAHLFACYAR